MNKRTIDPLEYASTIAQANPKGILFTTKRGDEVDTMIIGWGFVGNIWGTPMFVAYVRPSRHSFTLAEETGEFTVNVPDGAIDPQVFKVAGSESGRDVNKVQKLGLTLVEPAVVNAPAIAECPITLECKVAYKQFLDEAAIPERFLRRFYPVAQSGHEADFGRNVHIAYYGEIVASYIVEE